MEADVCMNRCWRCPMYDTEYLYPECYKKLKEMKEDDERRDDRGTENSVF